jgi:predicted ribonuclease YlaK
MSHRVLFLDSNILLHYTFFTDLDWPKLGDAGTVELVFPYTVISTLDKKKFDSADAAVRERARKVIAKLEGISMLDNPRVRENVTFCLLDQEPEIDYARWGLSRESEDDRIIAEILYYREIHPGREVSVVTGDFGLKLKCKRHDIPIFQLAAEHSRN